MNLNFKRLMSILLTLTLAIGMAAPVLATGEVSLSATDQTVVSGDTAQTVTVELQADSAISIAGYQIHYSIMPSGLTLGTPSTALDGTAMAGSDNLVWFSSSGVPVSAGGTIMSIPVTVPANAATSSYTLTFTIDDMINAADSSIALESNTVTAKITVTMPSLSEDPDESTYDLYYRLDSELDADSDGYKEYGASDTVTASIYLRPHSNQTLQAFDIYVENDTKLTRGSVTGNNGVGTMVESGTGKSTATMTRIQAIGSETSGGDADAVSVPLTGGVEYLIGTIQYSFAGSAQYDEELAITILNTSNIGIEGTPEKRIPAVISNGYSGAEINTTYPVTYYANTTDDVTGGPTAQEKQYNIDLTLSSAVPTRTGYTFAGWNTQADGTGTNYAAGASYTTNAALELYAQWTANSYTITWKNYDGSELETSSAAYGTTPVYTGTTPTRDVDAEHTYTFVGWAETQGAAEALDPLPAVTGNATYYAVYSSSVREYTVSFDLNGQPTASPAPVNQSVPYGGTVTKPSDPAVIGYIFGGWYTESDCTTEYNFDTTVNGDLTLYAKWTVLAADKYTVTYDLSGADNAADFPGATEYAAGEAVTIVSTTPTKSGYVFDHWELVSAETVTLSGLSFTMPAANVSVKAVWSDTPTSYTITFKDGDTVLHVANYSIETSLTLSGLLDDPTRTTHNFAGWRVTVTGGNWPAVNEILPSSTSVTGYYGNVTLTAVWTPKSYDITFNAGDHGVLIDGIENPVSVEYDKPYTLPAGAGIVTPKTGYTFYKWLVNGVEKGAGDVITVTDDVTVTAEYSLNSYTITLNPNGGTVVPTSITYTIETPISLPLPTNTGYEFLRWSLTSGANDVWIATSYSSGNIGSGYHGDVTLTAEWKFDSNNYAIEEYKYANGTYLLRISDDLTDQEYRFGGVSMYRMRSSDPGATYYLVNSGDKGVFYTLIPSSCVTTEGGTLVLTDDGAKKIAAVSVDSFQTVTYNGDVNGDEKFTIADANAVYQMVEQTSQGTYYTTAQLSDYERLVADMDKDNTGVVHRGSIADVHAIVNIVNDEDPADIVSVN